jgi:hypothetical protein
MEHIQFLEKPDARPVQWLVWFVCVGGAVAVGGFLALLAHADGLI